MLKVLIVDDEPLALDRLRRLLGASSDVQVVGEAHDGEEALEKISALKPEVVFLDIEMPVATGLEVVRSLGSSRPKIVFCTSYDQYAVEAFELHAVDYLMKPVTRARLERTLERLRQTSAADWDAAVERIASTKDFGHKRLLARHGARYRVVAVAEIEYFSSEDGISILHTASARFIVDPTLNTLEGRLDASQFFRISRRAIVKLECVVEVAPLMGGYGEVRLPSGTRLPVSRRRFRELLARLEGRQQIRPT
jgi:two-component system LytT family response regulator